MASISFNPLPTPSQRTFRSESIVSDFPLALPLSSTLILRVSLQHRNSSGSQSTGISPNTETPINVHSESIPPYLSLCHLSFNSN